MGRGARGWAYSIARPWVPISSSLTHGLSFAVLNYLAGSKSVSARPPDPDTMTNAALEAIASSSGKNDSKLFDVKLHRSSVVNKILVIETGFQVEVTYKENQYISDSTTYICFTALSTMKAISTGL